MIASPPNASTEPSDDDALVPLAPVTELLKLFAKAVRAHQLYLPNNPMHVRALDAVRAAFPAVWAHTDVLSLIVTDTAFVSEGRAALEEPGRGNESLPWVFYKDGVRGLEMRPGFETRDLDVLLDVVQRARTRQATDDDDLLTLLWERDFDAFQYHYVELGADGSTAPGADLLRKGGSGYHGAVAPPATIERDASNAEPIGGSSGTPPSSSPFARVDDFDTTLYFLESNEVAYLQQAIRDEFACDLRPIVVAGLLDTFEREADPTVREEICGILESLLVTLLANLQFRTVAYLLRESVSATERAVELVPSQQTRLLNLSARLSEPDVLQQLLVTLEDTPLRPPQDDLHQLFAQLRPSALVSVLSHISKTHNPELRALMEGAITRIIAGNTAELVKLIGSDDEAIATEAIRRAGAVRSPATVAPLAKLLTHTSVDVRKLAVTALVDIGSTGAMQAIERAVEDAHAEIRIIAVRALGERQQRSALPRVERMLKGFISSDASTGAEKAAFLEAYGALGGDTAVTLLDGILNPKGFLTRKEDSQTRAYAATALGKVGTDRALDALRKASGDKDVIVRTAAARALRGAT